MTFFDARIGQLDTKSPIFRAVIVRTIYTWVLIGFVWILLFLSVRLIVSS